MTGDGHFGKWIVDNFGLPAYEYTCDQEEDPIAKTPTTYGYSTDHFHQLGNDRITATAHNGGYIQVLESSRNFQWLTYYDKKNEYYGGGIGVLYDENANNVVSDLYDSSKIHNFQYRRIFGMGYFQKSLNFGQLELTHNICVPFSDDPVVVSEFVIRNTSKDKSYNNLNLFNYWGVNLHHILKSLVVSGNNRKEFGKSRTLNFAGKLLKNLQKLFKLDTDGSRRRFDKKFRLIPISDTQEHTVLLKTEYTGRSKPKLDEPAKHNFYPRSIFLSLIRGKTDYKINGHEIISQEKIVKIKETLDKLKYIKLKQGCLLLGTKISLKPGESKRFEFLFGYADQNEIGDLIQKFQNIVEKESILEWNAKNWNQSFVELNIEGQDWLSRESKWHSYYTRSACFFDEFYNHHRFPQGSVYLFGHGFDGAIRDYMLYLLSIVHINPKLAKEYLSLSLSFMSSEGRLPYGLYGFGKTLSAAVHSRPSDLYLFLLWGILEYIYATRDFDFLREEIPYYPKSENKTSQVIVKIENLILYFFGEYVGFGEHDLIKCNDGDWNDGISLMVKKRKKFIKYGESNFNSTFALYLFPKLLPLLKQDIPELVEFCEQNLSRLKKAVLNTWNGKWFYRGYDGLGTPIGDKNIYLEHHTWLLLSKIINDDQARVLIDNIFESLDERSPIGQYISYPPQKTMFKILPEGWDVNGGVWHAMNSLLTWAYSKYDPEKALNSLKKNSLYQRAEKYPDIWYGIWSGPDSYIADYAEDAGQAFYHIATPMRDFPLMNLNAHACYLLSIIKNAGIEAKHDSIIISQPFKNRKYSFKSQLIALESTEKSFSVSYNPFIKSNFLLKIEKPQFYNEYTIVLLNGEKIRNNPKILSEDKQYLEIKISEKIKDILVEISQ